MNIIGIAGIAIIAAILSAMLKRYHQEYAIIINIAAGVLIVVQILANISPAISQLNVLLSSSGISSEYMLILFKALGICFLAQFAADSCKDAGETALAAKVEFAGKITIVLLSLPMFENIAATAVNLIGAKG
jgi:stage III sporulation protein AD